MIQNHVGVLLWLAEIYSVLLQHECSIARAALTSKPEPLPLINAACCCSSPVSSEKVVLHLQAETVPDETSM